MTEGDYGVSLEITVEDATFALEDEMRFIVKAPRTSKPLVDIIFSNITENKAQLILTEAESKKLPKGEYVYVLDWYQSGVFLCNIIPGALFKVVGKG